MDVELQIEPIVGKDEIWRRACQAADAGFTTPDPNPYPPSTRAHLTYELNFWERIRWLNGEETG